MTWDELFNLWQDSCQTRQLTQAQERLLEARQRLADNTTEDWDWLKAALVDPERKWFVAWVFRDQKLPRRLFQAMVQAAVMGCDAHNCRWFIEPCVDSFGSDAVLEELQRLRQEGDINVHIGVKKCLPWVQAGPRRERGGKE